MRSIRVGVYSIRRAWTGLMDAARRAGIHPARVAAAIRTATEMTRTAGSISLISYNCDWMYLTQ